MTSVALAESLLQTEFHAFLETPNPNTSPRAKPVRILRPLQSYTLPAAVVAAIDFVDGLADFPFPRPIRTPIEQDPNAEYVLFFCCVVAWLLGNLLSCLFYVCRPNPGETMGFAPHSIAAMYKMPWPLPPNTTATSHGVVGFERVLILHFYAFFPTHCFHCSSIIQCWRPDSIR